MSKYSDRDLGMNRNIPRRDFVSGVGTVVAGSLFAGSLVAPQLALAQQTNPIAPQYYPPGMTGMRGSHPGSFETGQVA